MLSTNGTEELEVNDGDGSFNLKNSHFYHQKKKTCLLLTDGEESQSWRVDILVKCSFYYFHYVFVSEHVLCLSHIIQK